MKKSFFIILIATCLLLPEMVYADIYAPFMLLSNTLLFVLFILEVTIVYLIIIKLLNYKIKPWKIILSVFVANLVTYFLGLLILNLYWGKGYSVTEMEYLNLITSFIFSIVFEWLILMLFLKTIKKKELLVVSVFMNFASYTVITYFFVQKYLI